MSAIDSYAGLVPEQKWSSLIGIVTAIVGNLLISVALNTQRYAHIRIDREFKDKQDPEAKHARRQLPKKLRYGTIIQQEEAAEERQRINEEAEVPSELNGGHDGAEDYVLGNGKTHAPDDSEHEEDEEDEEDKPKRKPYLKSPWWWLGLSLMVIGEGGNFLAYGFAGATIVAPLGVVALISNCLIAPFMLKERFRQRDFWGVLVAIGGAVLVVLSANQDEKKLGPGQLLRDIKRWEFLVYIIITLVFIVALMIASPKYGERTILIDLGLVGLYGGYTALSTKGVASLLSTSLYRAFQYPIFYILVLVLVGSAVLQVRYLNKALQNFDSTQVIPTQFVLFTLSVITGSAVLYRDFETTDLDHVVRFICGCLLTFGGVYLITSGRRNQDNEEDEEVAQHDVERIRLLDDERTTAPKESFKQETTDLKLDTNLTIPETPRSGLSRTTSTVPSIAVTPAAFSADELNKNPFISSTDDLARMHVKSATDDRPHTPTGQTIGSTSQTPFFTPSITQPLSRTDRLTRAISSPARPETPSRRGTSSPKVYLEPSSAVSTLKRSSISRLVPGPIMQPLSSSLAGIVADRILRGEGTDSPLRSSLRRHKSNRESARLQGPVAGASDTDLEAGVPSAFASETSIQRSDDVRRARAAVGGEDSPLLRRTVTHTDGSSDPFGSAKGRLRSMSETLTNFMRKDRRGSKDSGSAEGSGHDRS